MDKTIGLACNISTGKLDANKAVSGGEYPFFTCAEFPDQIDHFAYDDDVVLVAGNNARGNFHVSRYNGKFNAYQRTYILTAKKGFNIDYVYYALKLELKRLREKSQGSQTKFLTMPILTGIHFRDITGDEQTEIANVLSAIDQKIELNNQINAELEAMAKTLYDYWFVQFDFPDANGKPYKTSGGKMVFNPTLKREVPQGWASRNILSIADLFGGGTPTKIKPEYWNGSIPFFTPTDSDGKIFCFETADYITEEGLNNSSTRLFEPHTVFITARGSVGRLALNAVPMAMNQSCYALRAKDGISYSFLFFLTKELIHHLEVKASGSVFNSIVSNDIEYTNLALPNEAGLFEKYAEIAEPIFRKIEIATKENLKLSSLRDWLLPMLMNGQVTVK